MPATVTGLSVDTGVSPGAIGARYNIADGDVTFVPASYPADTLWLLAVVGVGVTGLGPPDPLRPLWPEPTTPTDWTVLTNDGWWVGVTDNIADTTFEGLPDTCGIAWVSYAITGWDVDGPSLYPGLGIAGITVAAQQADATPYVLDPSNPQYGAHVEGRSIIKIAGDGFQRFGGNDITPSPWTDDGTSFTGWDNRIEAWIATESGTTGTASTLPGRDSAVEAAEDPPNANWTWPVLTPAAMAIEFTDTDDSLQGWSGFLVSNPFVLTMETGDGWDLVLSVQADEVADVSPNYVLVEVEFPVEMAATGGAFYRVGTIDVGGGSTTYGGFQAVTNLNDAEDHYVIREYLDEIDWSATETVNINVNGIADLVGTGDVTYNIYRVEPTSTSLVPLLTPEDIWEGVYP